MAAARLLAQLAEYATQDPVPAWRASAGRLLQRMRQELPGPTYVNVIAPLGSDRETGERVWALRRDALGGTPWMDVLASNPVWRAVGGRAGRPERGRGGFFGAVGRDDVARTSPSRFRIHLRSCAQAG